MTSEVIEVGQHTSARSRRRDPARRASPAVYYVLATLGLLLLTLPGIVVILAGLNSGTYLTFPPSGFSLRWVKSFLTGDLIHAYLFSLEVAAFATIIATFLGLLASLFLSRTRFRGKAYMRAYFLAPLTLPAVVLGFALYVFYVETNMGLAQTLIGLVIGHVIVCTPYVVAMLSGALAGLDGNLEQAARSLGASPLKAFMKVTFPLILPGVVGGAVFAFIVSFGQFEVSLFLSTPNLQPLPIALYQAVKFEYDPTIAGAGVFAIALVVISMLLINHIFSLQKVMTVRLN